MLSTALAAIAVAPKAAAETAFHVEGASQAVTAATVSFDGRDYVALTPLVNAAGGDTATQGFAVTVRIDNEAARLTIGDTEVNGPRGWFLLRHRLQAQGGRAFIAEDDVTPFFRRAFALEARAAEQGPPDTAPADDEPQLAPITPIEPAPEREAPDLDEPAPDLPTIFDDPPREPERRFVVVVDAGHGGTDNGAIGPSGLAEKEVTLAVARKLKEQLEDRTNARVALTREDDRSLSTAERQRIAQRENADLFISIHTGALNDNQGNGHAVYFHHAEIREGEPVARGSAVQRAQERTRASHSQALAEAIARALPDAGGHPVQRVQGIPCRPLAGLTVPAVLVELDNLIDSGGETRLGDEDHRSDLAAAIAAGVESYRAN